MENTQVVGRCCPSLVPPAGNISDGDFGIEVGVGQVSHPAALLGFPAFPRCGIPPPHPHRHTQGLLSPAELTQLQNGLDQSALTTSVTARGASYSGWAKFNPSTLRHTLSTPLAAAAQEQLCSSHTPAPDTDGTQVITRSCAFY